MRTEDELQTEYLSERMGLVFSQDSSLTPGSSRSSSSCSSGNSSDSSYSSIDRSRSPSVSRRSRGRHRHGSHYSSSSENSSHSRSRSRPRCCRALYHSRCRSRSHSPYPRRKCSRSNSRSSSRERYYRRSRRSRSSYRRTRGAYTGRSRRRFSPSRTTRHHGSKSRSPERSVRLGQKDRTDLLNIAKENAEKSLGVALVKLPVSVRYTEGHMNKTLESETEKMPRAESALPKKPPQDEDDSGEGFEISTSPGRKPVSFSFSDSVAKPSSIPVLHVTENKATSQAKSTGNTSPHGNWIPVKTASKKKKAPIL